MLVNYENGKRSCGSAGIIQTKKTANVVKHPAEYLEIELSPQA